MQPDSPFHKEEIITTSKGVNMGGSDKEEATFQGPLTALNDLAKAQKEMVEEMRQQNHNKGNNGESYVGERVGTSQNIVIINPKSQPYIYSGISRPTKPKFMRASLA